MNRVPFFVALFAAGCANEDLYDFDGDGHGSVEGPCRTCDDCDDNDPDVHPDADEVCGDGVDNDCDGVVDDVGTGAVTLYVDADEDAFGTGDALTGCLGLDRTSVDDGDCDDGNAAVHPGATDTCNGTDDDCDGQVDEPGQDGDTWFRDDDGDEYGDPASSLLACEMPEQDYVADSTDCDDTDDSVFPGAPDAPYDDVDSDCSGGSDYDADGDGYERDLDGGDDCDDDDAAVNPVATEVCNDGVDNDCDGGPGSCELTGTLALDSVWDARIVLEGDFDLPVDVGDVNGDGVMDVVIAGSIVPLTPEVNVFLGPITGDLVGSDRDASILHDADALVAGGDLDGDGIHDVVFRAGAGVLAFEGRTSWPVTLGPTEYTASFDGAPYPTGLAVLPAPMGLTNDVLIIGHASSGSVSVFTTPRTGEDSAIGGDYLLAGDVSGPVGPVGNALAGSTSGFFAASNGGGHGVGWPPPTTLPESVSLTGVVDGDPSLPHSPGDLTGDGTDDIVLGYPGLDRVYVLAGPVGDMDITTAPSIAWTGAPILAATSVAVGDVNGDGLDDLAVGAPGNLGDALDGGRVFVFYGALPPSGADASSADFVLEGPTGRNGGIGSGLEIADINADGIGDLVIAAAAWGEVFVIHGAGI